MPPSFLKTSAGPKKHGHLKTGGPPLKRFLKNFPWVHGAHQRINPLSCGSSPQDVIIVPQRYGMAANHKGWLRIPDENQGRRILKACWEPVNL